MKLSTLALATLFALSSTLALAHSHHHRHHHHMSRGSDNPNGTAGGGTTLSGTGIFSIRRVGARYDGQELRESPALMRGFFYARSWIAFVRLCQSFG